MSLITYNQTGGEIPTVSDKVNIRFDRLSEWLLDATKNHRLFKLKFPLRRCCGLSFSPDGQSGIMWGATYYENKPCGERKGAEFCLSRTEYIRRVYKGLEELKMKVCRLIEREDELDKILWIKEISHGIEYNKEGKAYFYLELKFHGISVLYVEDL